MPRAVHPNKHIEAALKYAEEQGWEVVKASGSAHAWGRARCPGKSRGDCQLSIWSTPRSPENHARQILRRVNACPHGHGEHE